MRCIRDDVVKLSLNYIFYLQAIFKHSSNCLLAGHSWIFTQKHQNMYLSRKCLYFQHITTSSQPIIFRFPLRLRGYRQLKLEHRRISSELKRKSLSRKPFTWNYQFSFAPSHKWSCHTFEILLFLFFSFLRRSLIWVKTPTSSSSTLWLIPL